MRVVESGSVAALCLTCNRVWTEGPGPSVREEAGLHARTFGHPTIVTTTAARTYIPEPDDH